MIELRQHWGPDPGHGGMTIHLGTVEACSGPDCGPGKGAYYWCPSHPGAESEQDCANLAFPHGPDEPCTCDDCHGGRYGCTGHVIGCTCDIEWDWHR